MRNAGRLPGSSRQPTVTGSAANGKHRARGVGGHVIGNGQRDMSRERLPGLSAHYNQLGLGLASGLKNFPGGIAKGNAEFRLAPIVAFRAYKLFHAIDRNLTNFLSPSLVWAAPGSTAWNAVTRAPCSCASENAYSAARVAPAPKSVANRIFFNSTSCGASLLTCGPTVSTAQSACRKTSSATEPSSTFFSWPRPWVPVTRKSI